MYARLSSSFPDVALGRYRHPRSFRGVRHFISALERQVEITWLGHSCFRLRGKDATIITDPHDRHSGYALGKV